MIYTARTVLPVTAPPIHGGAVGVRASRIVAVGSLEQVRKSMPAGTPVRDLGDAVLLPGLVNAHTHLELSWMADPPAPGGDYMSWLEHLVTRRDAARDPVAAHQAAQRQVQELVRRGTAAVGDVGNETWIAPILARSSLRGIVFHEIYGFRAADAERLLEEAAVRLDLMEADPDVRAARERLRIVLTPHAPHTLSAPLLKALAGRAIASREPLSIHLAESLYEVELLREGKGRMADFLRARRVWDDAFRPPGHSPVVHADRLGALTPRTLAVHCVHLDHQDLSKLQSRGVTVVTCPRSNARLGVGKAPVPKLLAAGIPVALGTDSLASAPSLDLFEEMAALRQQHPTIPPAAVLRMATETGAQALGLGKELGSIEPGKVAALVCVAVSAEDDPLEVVTSAPEKVERLAD